MPPSLGRVTPSLFKGLIKWLRKQVRVSFNKITKGELLISGNVARDTLKRSHCVLNRARYVGFRTARKIKDRLVEFAGRRCAASFFEGVASAVNDFRERLRAANLNLSFGQLPPNSTTTEIAIYLL